MKKPINGDKDIFRFAHLIFGEAFYYGPHFPGYSFSGSMRDCIVHFFGGDEGSRVYQPTVSTLSSTLTSALTPALPSTPPHPITKNDGKKIQGRSHHHLQHRQRSTLAKPAPAPADVLSSRQQTNATRAISTGRIERLGEPTKTTLPGTASASASPGLRVALPMFFHQLKTRDPTAFNQLLRVPVGDTPYLSTYSNLILTHPLNILKSHINTSSLT